MAQGTLLSTRPHVVIATPGRLRHHIESASPPALSRTKFLVLDEADRYVWLVVAALSSIFRALQNAYINAYMIAN